MPPRKDRDTPHRYRSGEAARLARMPAATLRIWERRYGVVAPPKTPSGQRLYSDDDVQRIRLLKTLVNQGHAIGSIASLSREELEALSLTNTRDPAFHEASVSLAVVGALSIPESAIERMGIRIAARIDSLDDTSAHAGTSVDALIATTTSLHEDVVSQLAAVAQQLNAHAVAVDTGSARQRRSSWRVCRGSSCSGRRKARPTRYRSFRNWRKPSSSRANRMTRIAGSGCARGDASTRRRSRRSAACPPPSNASVRVISPN